jgi:hypothetical protein
MRSPYEQKSQFPRPVPAPYQISVRQLSPELRAILRAHGCKVSKVGENFAVLPPVDTTRETILGETAYARRTYKVFLPGGCMLKFVCDADGPSTLELWSEGESAASLKE